MSLIITNYGFKLWKSFHINSRAFALSDNLQAYRKPSHLSCLQALLLKFGKCSQGVRLDGAMDFRRDKNLVSGAAGEHIPV